MSDNDNICSICFDPLVCPETENQVYKIQECGHSFHVDCLMPWWRSGKKSCPKCRDEGLAGGSNRFICKEHICSARQYARKKDAPIGLKNLVKKLIEKEKMLSEINKALSDHKNEVGVFKDLKNKERRLYTQKWRKSFAIMQLKRELQQLYPVEPILIVVRKEIGD